MFVSDAEAIFTPDETKTKDVTSIPTILLICFIFLWWYLKQAEDKDSDIKTALTSELQTILRNEVEYDEQEAKQNCSFLWDAVSGLVRVMCDLDPLFNEVYSHIVHAGSFYEGLRITSPDEFDLQIVMKFPFPVDSFTVSMSDANTPFVTHKLHDSPQQLLYSNYLWQHPHKKLAKFFDNDGFLSADHVLQWIHGVMELSIQSRCFIIPRTVSEIKIKPQLSSCPAFTLDITGAGTGTTISVDLVPVLDISGANIPRRMRRSKRFCQLVRNEEAIQWFLVPKPPKDTRDFKSQNLWRSAFPSTEKLLLSDTGCLKDMIKLFKRLRDINGNWRKPIYSYSIKAFFLRKFDKNPDLDYWSDDKLGKVFFESLEGFQDAMDKCYIPDYYNPKANMLDNMNPEAARNIGGRVKNIITLLRTDPANIRNVFNST